MQIYCDYLFKQYCVLKKPPTTTKKGMKEFHCVPPCVRWCLKRHYTVRVCVCVHFNVFLFELDKFIHYISDAIFPAVVSTCSWGNCQLCLLCVTVVTFSGVCIVPCNGGRYWIQRLKKTSTTLLRVRHNMISSHDSHYVWLQMIFDKFIYI